MEAAAHRSLPLGCSATIPAFVQLVTKAVMHHPIDFAKEIIDATKAANCNHVASSEW